MKMTISYLILAIVMAIIAIVLIRLARRAGQASDKNSKTVHNITVVMIIITFLIAIFCGLAAVDGMLKAATLDFVLGVAVIVAIISLVVALVCLTREKVAATWAFFLLMVIFAVFAIGGNVATAFASATKIQDAEATVSVEELNQATTTLTVDLDKLDLAKYSWCSTTLLDSSLTTKDAQRVASAGFSDALTFGFSGTDKLKEVQEEILRNPVYGVGFANFLKDLKIGNTTIGTVNPWMAEMSTKYSEVRYWLVYADSSQSTIIVTDEYRTYAAGLCNFLNLLIDKGVQTKTTSENWCLNCAAKSNNRAAVKASYQYTRETWVLQYVAKSGSVLLEFGLNTQDKRYELFADTEVVTTVATTTTSSTGSGGGGGDTPTPTPTPPTPTPTPIKDPSEDPVYQGNADIGGGKNLPDDGAGEFQPTEPDLEDYVPPNNNNNGDNNSSSGSGSGNGSSSGNTSGDGATPPATDPIPVHEDSHDTEDQNAGDNNGEFIMD